MSLSNNTTITVTAENETILGHQNGTCISVDSNIARIFKICAYCFILLGSFFGNILIIIVYKRRDLRKTINYFIVNMAVSDLLFPLVVIPNQVARLVTDSWHWRVSGILGATFCKLYVFTISVSPFVSVQSLVWIAIDRFVAVVFPIKLGLISSKIRSIAIVSTWLLACVFYFPWLVSSGLTEYRNNTLCDITKNESVFPNEGAYQGYYWLHVTIRLLAPLFVITVLYIAIVISLKRRRKALLNVAQYEPQHSVKKRRQATQMAVAILVLFYICVIPYTVLIFVTHLRPSCAFVFIAVFMFMSSSVVNPIICLSFVESYRRGLKSIVCCFCRMQDNKRAKRERVALKGMRSLSARFQRHK